MKSETYTVLNYRELEEILKQHGGAPETLDVAAELEAANDSWHVFAGDPTELIDQEAQFRRDYPDAYWLIDPLALLIAEAQVKGVLPTTPLLVHVSW